MYMRYNVYFLHFTFAFHVYAISHIRNMFTNITKNDMSIFYVFNERHW